MNTRLKRAIGAGVTALALSVAAGCGGSDQNLEQTEPADDQDNGSNDDQDD